MKNLSLISALLLVVISYNMALGQDNRMIRIAEIRIDPAYLEEYKGAIKEHIEAAVRVEPGVLTLYAVQDKKDPTKVTVFEIYANAEAYQSHLKTEHFKKYKAATAHMVKSLELIDVSAIAMMSKK